MPRSDAGRDENLPAQVMMTGILSLIVFMGLLVIVSIDHPFTGPVHVGAEPLQTVDGNRRFRSRLDRIGCNLVGGVQAAAKFKHAFEARFASGETLSLGRGQ